MTPRRVIRLALVFVGLVCSGGPFGIAFAATEYQSAVDRWSQLRANPSKLQLRHHWMPVLAGFKEVSASGSDRDAHKALYMEAKLWEELYSISRRRADLIQSHRAALALADRYPASRLADDALWIASRQARDVLGPVGRSDELLVRLLREHPEGDMAPKARAQLGDTALDTSRTPPETEDSDIALQRLTEQLSGRLGTSSKTSISRIRSWRGKSSRRVVLELSQPVEYQARRVSGNVFEVRMASKFEHEEVRSLLDEAGIKATVIYLGHSLIVRFREADRIVAAVETFVLEEPFRLILEVGYEEPVKIEPTKPPSGGPTKIARPKSKSDDKPKASKPLVVLDPGHGGKDSGAKGHQGLLEKDLTLKIALNLERELRKHGLDVLLTRRDDSYVSLEDRTALANQKNAALFVSIHLNAHSAKSASGIETYFLDTTDDKYSLRLAATENKTSQERVSEIQLAMVGLSMRYHTEESEALANEVQDAMTDVAHRYRQGGVRDLGVKSSLFYVLLGARMPAILAEVGFITNPLDAELLNQRWYRRKLAASMAQKIGKVISSNDSHKVLKSMRK